MISYSHTEAEITDVEEVIIEPLQSSGISAIHQRCITVRTERGETFDLVLQATKPRRLRFRKKQKHDWVTPILYKPDDGNGE